MRRSILALAATAVLVLPTAVSAQGFGVAARAGSLGIGAEAAVGLSSKLVLRGGLGLMPLEIDPTRFWDAGPGVEATLKLPGTWYNVGADLYLGSSFRIGGGMLFKPDDPELTATLAGTATINIGGVDYTASDVAEVTGVLVSKSSAPYVLIGFGKHTASGIGLFLDLGAAFLGDPDITLAARGNNLIVNDPAFIARLRAEEAEFENDVGTYLKIWPIVNIGVRVGLGN